MTEAEIQELFDQEGDILAIKAWIKEGLEWHVGDVRDEKVGDVLGCQDIVIANNFLCHMDPTTAGRCLRNIARLVRPSGYLFVSGIDLDVRTSIAKDLGWRPMHELLEEIYYGDPRMEVGWPWNYSSVEPLNKKRRDWRLRYAAAFRLVRVGEVADDFAALGKVENVRTGRINSGVGAAAPAASGKRTDDRTN
jgi:SAM-dependent methyltransferase